MIVKLGQFNIDIAKLEHFMTGSLWSSLPRVCSGAPAARILLVSDLLNPDDIVEGFDEVAPPLTVNTPRGLRAYHVQYRDFLRRTISTEVRYLRAYLVLDTNMDETALCRLLGTHGVPASPLSAEVPRPFSGSGLDRWNRIETDDGQHFAMLCSKAQQSGSIYPRSLHKAFELDFSIWMALNIYTFPPAEARDILRRKGHAVKYGKAEGDARVEAEAVGNSISSIQAEMNQYNSSLHSFRLRVLVGGGSKEELKDRLEILRSALPFEMEPERAAEIPKIFSARTLSVTDATAMTTPGVAVLVGSALGYRRRTETRGIYLGQDRHQSPVIVNVFDERASSHNGVVLGQTGSGKTFFIQLLMLRHLLLGVRGIIIDPQGNIKLPFLQSDAYHRSTIGDATSAINILDITSDVLMEQVNSVKHIMTMLGVLVRGDATSGAVMDRVLMNIYRPLWDQREQIAPASMPTLHHVQTRLADIAGRSTDPEETRSVAQQMAQRLQPYTQGSLASLFGRPTSVDFSLTHAMTIFDVSKLPDQQLGGDLRAVLLAILVADINQAILRRRRAGDEQPYLFFVDEIGILMRDAVIAAYISAQYKTARSRRVGMFVADQSVTSLIGSADENGLHHGELMLANAAFRFVFMQPPDQIGNIQKYFPQFPAALIARLPSFPVGSCIAELQTDLLQINIAPMDLDRVVLSSRVQDQKLAQETMQQLIAEMSGVAHV